MRASDSAHRSNLVDVTVRVLHRTAKAALVTETGHSDDAVWLPLSQIELEPIRGTLDSILTLPAWLAHEKGLV